MKVAEVRQKYINFFKASPRNHKEITSAPLVLKDDPTTLFTSSGMQPLVPYLSGKKHPKGKRLVNSQPSIRLQDIELVGDSSHTTFFEMLGNWSLGDYFKKDQLPWFWEFLVKEIGLEKDKLYVSVSSGGKGVPKDTESYETWKKLGVADNHIFTYPVHQENWWSMTGSPDNMLTGDIGGPDSEVFYEFSNFKHNPKFGKRCIPNCECGRYLEIGNSVFIQYKKLEDGSLTELPQKNIDFGGGLERLTAATLNDPDIFMIDAFRGVIKSVEQVTGKRYSEESNKSSMRIITDHTRASVFLIDSGVKPSNKGHGYVLRRLIRRSLVKLRNLTGDIKSDLFSEVVPKVIEDYKDSYLKGASENDINSVIVEEIDRFEKSLNRGMKEISKVEKVDGKKAFDLYQTYGFPLEVTMEIFKEKGQRIKTEDFNKEFEKHKNLSRTASAGMFKGGLADHSQEVKRLHTATHLLQESLRRVLGEHVEQKGQNITSERSRFDFSHGEKLSEKELKKVEDMINVQIDKDLSVANVVVSRKKAKESGALHFFGEKYSDDVSVYYVGKSLESAFSKEFCGGPHVSRTSEIGHVRISRQKKIGTGVVRIYLELDG